MPSSGGAALAISNQSFWVRDVGKVYKIVVTICRAHIRLLEDMGLLHSRAMILLQDCGLLSCQTLKNCLLGVRLDWPIAKVVTSQAFDTFSANYNI